MSLRQRVYSVLVVSSADNFNHALCGLLPASEYEPVLMSADIGSARRALAERDYDFVIVNSPLPDEFGTRFAIDISDAKNASVLMLVRAEFYAEIYDKVAEHGVLTLSKPTSKQMLMTALDWMSSMRERLRKFEQKTLSIEEKMEEIRIVNRAKWLLISELHMDEPAAHRYIEKQAMDRCVSRRTVAEEIVKTYT